jgi:hypothetical protein
MYAGVNKFRSASEVDEEFSGLSSKYPNLENKRTLKKAQFTKKTDLLTLLDAQYLLKLILN